MEEMFHVQTHWLFCAGGNCSGKHQRARFARWSISAENASGACVQERNTHKMISSILGRILFHVSHPSVLVSEIMKENDD